MQTVMNICACRLHPEMRYKPDELIYPIEAYINPPGWENQSAVPPPPLWGT